MTHLKVLHVYRTYFPDPPGGLQEAIRQIALSLQGQSVESRIFTLSTTPSPDIIERSEGHVHRARSYFAPASCDIGGLSAFTRFRKQAEWADIIHYQFPWPFADLLHFFAAPRKPTVMTYHSDIIGKGTLAHIYKPLMLRMLRSMDAVVATSPAYVDSSPIIKTYVPADRRHIIPLGIDEASYAESIHNVSKICLSQRFGINDEGYFLFVGVLRPYKGLHNLARAAIKSGLPVVIAGSGPQHIRLSEISRNAGNIKLLGQVSDAEKMALIKGCRAAILPSNLRSEAFGIFLIEAAMCAKPMISCEIGTGTSYVNKHQDTGLVIPPDNSAALEQAMETLYTNPEQVNTFGRAARKRYDQMFSGAAQGEAYAKLYRSLL